MADKNEQGALTNAEAIIERFGGIRPMASKMEVPVTTVQGWKKRNVIPENRRDDVLRAASLNNIDLSDLAEKGAANENATSRLARPDLQDALKSFRDEVRAATMQDAEEDISSLDETDQGTENSYEEENFAEQTAPSTSTSPRFEVNRSNASRAESTGADPSFRLNTTSPVSKFNVEPDGDEIAARILASERRSVRKSVAASALLILIIGGIAGMLLLPQVANDILRLNTLDGHQAEVDKRLTLLEQGAGSQPSAPPNISQQLSALQDQVKVLTQQAQSNGGSVALPDASAMAQRLDALETKVGQLASSGGLTRLIGHLHDLQDSAEGQQELSAAAQSLNTLMQANSDNLDQALADAQQQTGPLGDVLKGVDPIALKQAALLIGLTELRTSIGHSAPFDDDLSLMRTLLGSSLSASDKASFAQLADVAKQGVLTGPALQDQLHALSPAIVGASLNGQNISMKEKAIARLNDLVQVSKDGDMVTGTDTQAKVARAQDSLIKGNIQGALNQLHGLDAASAAAAKPFVDNADMTIHAQKLLASVSHIVSGILSMGGAPLTPGDAGAEPISTKPADTRSAPVDGPDINSNKAARLKPAAQQP